MAVNTLEACVKAALTKLQPDWITQEAPVLLSETGTKHVEQQGTFDTLLCYQIIRAKLGPKTAILDRKSCAGYRSIPSQWSST